MEALEILIMTKTQVLDLIAQHTRDIVPGLEAHLFVESDRLVDLGADSVDRGEIMMLVQESSASPCRASSSSGRRTSASSPISFSGKSAEAA